VPINDLTIRHNDLIAATAGRSFWILDDLSFLQQDRTSDASVFLANPRDTYLFTGGYSENPSPGMGQNPRSGVILDYYLAAVPDSAKVTMEILEGGEVIRTYTNQPPKDFKSWPGGPPKPQVLPAKPGYNRFVWDFRRETLPAVENVFVMGDYRGSRVAPGTYTVRLSQEGVRAEQSFTILPNPKVSASPAAYAAQQEALVRIDDAIRDMHGAVGQLRGVKSQLKTHQALLEDNEKASELLEKGAALQEDISTWEENLIQPRQKTFQDVINYNNQLNAELMNLRSYIDVAEPELTQGANERLSDLLGEWNKMALERDTIVNTGMSQYNALYRQLELPALIMGEK
jgi:cell fate (sporulation/competence/biofilm development) regulator YlbF (YheA/YmcA/DUF963 family)